MNEIQEATYIIEGAVAAGASAVCGKCHGEASLIVFCDGGKCHGTSCKVCWDKHIEYIEFASILIASEMAEAVDCSRCGSLDVPTAHIHAKGIHL